MPFAAKASGTWRTATALSVKASGAWRTAVGVWVKASGTWRQALGLLNGNLTVANSGATYGYVHGTGLGALTPNTLNSGALLISEVKYVASGIPGTPLTQLSIGALSGNMASVTATNLVKGLTTPAGALETSAASFTNFTSTCVWTWSGDTLGLQAASGTTIFLQVRAP